MNATSTDVLLEPDATAPTTPEAVALPTERIDFAVLRKFEDSFKGIDEKQLEKIAGFTSLSTGQQLLTLRNLQSLVFDKVKNEARARQQDEWAKLGGVKRLLLQIWNAGAQPEKRIAQLEKELAQKHYEGSDREGKGMTAENIVALGDLVKVAAQGSEVEVNKQTGALEIKYISRHELFDSLNDKLLTTERLGVMERYNKAADQYAKYPHEWSYETDKSQVGIMEKLFSKDRKEYNKARAEYESARTGMLALYVERAEERGESKPERAAAMHMNQVDERVELNQLFNTHPDAEQALLQIKDQSIVLAAAKQFAKNKGFLVYGALTRAAVVALSGGMALPAIGIIAAGAGGLVGGAGIGAAEAKKLIKQRRADGRMSDTEAREKVSYDVLKKDPVTNKPVTDENGNYEVLRTETRDIKEYTDATFFIDRIERLSNKLEQATEPRERTLLETKIAQTVVLMREKNLRGMINFGGSELDEKDERKGMTIANRLSFIQAMAKGDIETTFDREAFALKIEDAAGLHQGTIEEKRRKEILSTAAKGALIRGGFALAGGLIAQQASSYWHGRAPAHAPLARPSAHATASVPAVSTPASAAASSTPPSGQSLHARLGANGGVPPIEVPKAPIGGGEPLVDPMKKLIEGTLPDHRAVPAVPLGEQKISVPHYPSAAEHPHPSYRLRSFDDPAPSRAVPQTGVGGYRPREF